MTYKIYPIRLGTTSVDRSLYEYRYPAGERIEVAYGCFLIKGNGKIILFDSGLPDQEEIHRIGLTFGYMDNPPQIMDELAKMGVKPEDVDAIIVSHLHWDHSWNMDKFPRAELYVQKREMEHAISPLPHERTAYGLAVNEPGCPSWLRVVSRLKALEGDAELFPGIRAVTTPGHTPGSQSALVATEDGCYALVSDFALTDRCYREGVLTGIFTSADDWYASYKKLRAIGPKVLTTHSPSTYAMECYG